jgi:hypothetical protein
MKAFCVVVLLLSVTGVAAAGEYVVPTTTLSAQTANNTSAANGFATQSNGNGGAGNVSHVDVHSLLYSGATTKVYAHLLLWFGGSNHMNVGYNSTDAAQIHRQITDMIGRGIDGVIIDWYGPNNSIDQATKLVMAEAETHPGFTFAIMVDQGAIQWDSCSGCSPQQALITQMQYIEQTYFPSPAYMTDQGRPVVTNFNIDLAYSIDWTAVNAALSTKPALLFQNNSGFTHVLSEGSYSWVMPTTTDYGMSYLKSFYDTGIPLTKEQTAGAAYKGFNDSLAAWGSGRSMGQQCGQTWLQTFSEINSQYNSGRQLPAMQLVTWNDYEEGTEIESGIGNCFALSAAVAGNQLIWTTKGNVATIDHYVAYISTDGQNLMALDDVPASTSSINLCHYPIPNGKYTVYVQGIGKPSIANQISGAVKYSSSCGAAVTLGTNPSALSVAPGRSSSVTVTATPESGPFNNAIALSCPGLPSSLSCAFKPASITPGSNAVSSVLTISAASTTAAERRTSRINYGFAFWLSALGMIGFTFTGKLERRNGRLVFAAFALAVLLGSCTSCGGGTAVASGNLARSYAVTVSGIAGSVQLSTTVTVTMQ